MAVRLWPWNGMAWHGMSYMWGFEGIVQSLVSVCFFAPMPAFIFMALLYIISQFSFFSNIISICFSLILAPSNLWNLVFMCGAYTAQFTLRLLQLIFHICLFRVDATMDRSSSSYALANSSFMLLGLSIWFFIFLICFLLPCSLFSMQTVQCEVCSALFLSVHVSVSFLLNKRIPKIELTLCFYHHACILLFWMLYLISFVSGSHFLVQRCNAAIWIFECESDGAGKCAEKRKLNKNYMHIESGMEGKTDPHTYTKCQKRQKIRQKCWTMFIWEPLNELNHNHETFKCRKQYLRSLQCIHFFFACRQFVVGIQRSQNVYYILI